MDALLQDLRYAWRSLRRAPLFTVTSVVILALGIGVASAHFGIVHHLLVAPLHVREPKRLVMVSDRVVSRGELRGYTSPARWHAFRGARSLEHLEAYAYDTDAVLQETDGSRSVQSVRSTPELFRVIGVALSAGRDFTPDDARPGAERVALVSERFAHARLGGTARTAGRMLRLDGVPTTIIGVLPSDGELPVGADLWRPLSLEGEVARDREDRSFVGVASLRPGATLEGARAELVAIGHAESASHPETDRDLEPRLQPLQEGVLDAISPTFERIACVALVLMLMVVAANLAGLQLARGASRRREWAVRAAIGATPGRLARQSLVESLSLAVVGGVLGIWVAGVTVRLVGNAMSGEVTRYIPGWSRIAVDGIVLGYAFAVTLLTGVAFGLIPALHAGRAPAARTLRHGGSGALGSVHARARGTMVVAEVALSLSLLVGGALMADGFRRMSGPDLGFDPHGVLTMQLRLQRERHPDAAERSALHTRALERLAALPGVTGAAMISSLPSSGSTSGLPVTPEGGELAGGKPPRASIRVVTPGLFEVLRLPIVRGRAIEPGDAANSPAVVVVNETLARRAWPQREAVGRRLRFADPDGSPQSYTVVGVARDVKRNWFERDVAPMVYVADAQWGAPFMNVTLRTTGEPAAIGGAARRALAALAPDVPVDRMGTLDRILGERTSGVRVGAVLMAWLGLFALALAAIGLYGLIAFHVARRAPEFGVRMALGATREDIFGLVFGEGGRLVGVGLAIGAPIALALGWVMTATMFGVVRPSVVTLAGISTVLLLAAGVASFVPAWRASRLNPTEALRRE